MTIEGGNAPINAEENANDSALSLIGSLRGSSSEEAPASAGQPTPAPAPAPAPENPAQNMPQNMPPAAPAPPVHQNTNNPENVHQPAQTPAAAPAPAPTPEEAQAEADAEAKRNAILREIAINPALSQQYAQQQFQPQFQQPHAPAHAPYMQQPPAQQAPELPFDEFTFDPSNAEHQRALIAAQLQEVGGPLFEMVNRIAQREEAAEEQRQLEEFDRVVKHANQTTVSFLDTYVPGFSGIADKILNNQPISAQERAVFNEAANAESAIFEWLEANNIRDARYNVQHRLQIAQQIGPKLKEYAKDLGLVAQPSPSPTPTTQQLTPEQLRVYKQESYVESSNAVPAANASNFEKAVAKKDIDGMIGSLRGK